VQIGSASSGDGDEDVPSLERSSSVASLKASEPGTALQPSTQNPSSQQHRDDLFMLFFLSRAIRAEFERATIGNSRISKRRRRPRRGGHNRRRKPPDWSSRRRGTNYLNGTTRTAGDDGPDPSLLTDDPSVRPEPQARPDMPNEARELIPTTFRHFIL
jgi:hypothetical protein